ncbi:MAG: HAMP domain-containing histidine kinase [Lachnospiraceae bacterium]|nr:HAMP domain-containing histidine kinase [Lachnospiraceae bacterium]
MERYLWGAVIVLIGVVVFLTARLWGYRRQIAHIKEELSFLEKEETNSLLSSFCAVGKTEEMIEAVNRLLLRYRKEEERLKSENRIYRESITSISHDIRTPLTSAKGYLQMLQKEELSAEKKSAYVRIVEQRLDHLTDMLNQLFEYARIEAGEIKLVPESFHAGNVFAETISMFYEDFVERGCEPEVIIADEVGKISTDKQAFIRIVENLLKNALVHGTGGYSLSLSCKEGYCLISVSNLTDSVEPGDVANIFERFYTTDKSRTKKTTGLGLAIVKRFATQMCGEAKAYLEDNRFTIEVRFPM